jgi:hypothetical protein
MSVWHVLIGAFSGSLVAAGIVAWFTQKWIEGRERRNRRDDLRLGRDETRGGPSADEEGQGVPPNVALTADAVGRPEFAGQAGWRYAVTSK